MVSSDSEPVTVATRHQNSQLVIRKLETSSHRQRPPVERVHAVGIHVPGKVGGTPDAADGDNVVIRYAQLDQGLLYGFEHAEIAASGTPAGIDFAFNIRHR